MGEAARYQTPKQIAARKEQSRRYDSARAHIVIEGRTFSSLHCVFLECQRRGFNGTQQAIYMRVSRGKSAITWEALTKPVTATAQKKMVSAKQRAKDEMAQFLAEYDKRKSGAQGK